MRNKKASNQYKILGSDEILFSRSNTWNLDCRKGFVCVIEVVMELFLGKVAVQEEEEEPATTAIDIFASSKFNV